MHLPCGIEKKSARKLVNAITCDKVKGKSCVRPAILFKAAVAISLGARQTAAIPVPMRIALSPSSSPLGSRQMSRSANPPRENRCASPDNDGEKRLLKRPKGEMRVRNNIYTRLDGLCHHVHQSFVLSTAAVITMFFFLLMFVLVDAALTRRLSHWPLITLMAADLSFSWSP